MSLARVKSLNAQILHARYLYYVLSAPILSDAEYDALEQELKALVEGEPKWRVYATTLMTVGSDLAQGYTQAIKHVTPMLSLDNAYTHDEVLAWAEGHPKETTYTIEPKVDGLSLSCRYVDRRLWLALTRGTGAAGEDVTLAAMTIPDIPKVLHPSLPPDLEIRGEVFMDRATFESLNDERKASGLEPFANPRNCASGSLKLKDPREVAKRRLSFQPWQVIGMEPPEGTTTPDPMNPQLPEEIALAYPGHTGLEHSQSLAMVHLAQSTRQPHLWRVYSKAELIQALEHNMTLKRTLWEQGLGMPLDGLVVKVEENCIRQQLGNAASYVKWAVAFKVQDAGVATVLRDVTWQVGRTGTLTPVGELEPVAVSGSVISRVLLNNLSFIRYDIGNPCVGDMVQIAKGGEVIPKVTGTVSRVEGGVEIPAPTHCPVCATEVLEHITPAKSDGAHEIITHECPNPVCPERMIAHLIYVGQRNVLNIEGLGDVVARRLVESGVIHTLGHLWAWAAEAEPCLGSAEFEAVVQAEGYSPAQMTTLAKSLIAARKAPWSTWLQALGIPMIAREMAKVLAQHLRLGEGDLLNLPAKLMTILPKAVEGLGPERLKAIQNWALSPLTEQDLTWLHEAGVSPLSDLPEVHEGGSPLASYTVVLTGEFGPSREVLTKILESLGATVKSGVSKKVNLLLVGSAPGNNKLSKASELNIRTEGGDWLRMALEAAGVPWPSNGMPDDLDEL